MPTLYQQYSGYSAILGRASRYGAGYPENANIVFAAGPDDRIGPERSENLTMSAHLTPARGLELTQAWYRIDYCDRVATPIAPLPGVPFRRASCTDSRRQYVSIQVAAVHVKKKTTNP